MVGVVVAGVLTFIVVRFHATSVEIASGKETRQFRDDVIMVTIVQEHELFVPRWTKVENAVTTCFVDHEELIVMEGRSHRKLG